MKIKNIILIILSVLCISWGVKAHQPDLSSTILVEQADDKWVLQVRAALTAFEYEIEEHFGVSSYTSPEEFNELVIAHVQENLSILINNAGSIKFQNGMVKLGHETSVTFEVLGIPETIESLNIRNESFSNIPRNQSALIVLKEGFSKEQFSLNSNNNHSVKLVVGDAKFDLLTPEPGETQNSYLIILGVLFTLSILYFALKKRQNIKLNSKPLNF
jgi:LPXTG-motif cell wall-anchored protein